jgi:hypothetical protein
MLNVLSLVSYQFLPPKMGGQKCIALGNKYLSKHLNLTCITTENNLVTEDVNYSVFNILSNSKLRYINIFYFFAIRNLINKNNISHIIIEHPYYGWLGILLKRFCNVKLIVRSHNIEANRFKTIGKWWWKLLWQYEKIIHKSADLSFFITEEDRTYSINNFGLDINKCSVVTYGFELKSPPDPQLKNDSKANIKSAFNIADEDLVILFNGGLDYKPNQDALDIILEKINPLLVANNEFKYKIIICGKNLPSSYENLQSYKSQNIIYVGFVDDIKEYYLAADIFINPVIDGGGIKTKIVEALGYNVSLVSTKSGAIGISNQITGNKMTIIADNNWNEFAETIQKINPNNNIPESFFDHFYWGKIAEKAYNTIKEL